MSDIYDTRKIPTSSITVINPKGEEPSEVPHIDAQKIQAILRAAETGDCRRLWPLYRDILIGDSHIQCELAKRKLALLGDPISVQPWDADNPADVDAAVMVEREIIAHRDFFTLCVHLLDAALWPLAIAEKLYTPLHEASQASAASATPRYAIARFISVPHRLIDLRGDQPRIHRADPLTGRASLVDSDEIDINRYILHRGHILSIPDRFGGPMRALIWWWIFGVMTRGWWIRYMERYGAPFMVGHVPRGDEDSRRTLETAFSWAVRIGGLVVNEGTQVEIKEALRSSGDAYDRFHAITRREISKLILGQTLSAEAQNTGMNTGVSDIQSEVRRDIRQFDGMALGRTISEQLFEPWLRHNGHPGHAPTLVWTADTTAASARTGELISKLYQAGLELDDEAIYPVSEQVGFKLRRREFTSMLPFGADREDGARSFFRCEIEPRGAPRH